MSLAVAVKRLIRSSMRRLGYEISRYRPSSVTDPFGNAINRLSMSGPIKTVFDIGANRGGTARRFANLFSEATIYAFEPFPPAYQELHQVSLDEPRIRSYPLAVGERDDTAELHLNAADVTNSLLRNAQDIPRFAQMEWCESRGAMPVRVTRIDTFCQERGIDTIDFLKVDTQGYELRVLDGCGQMLNPARIRALYLEVLFIPLYEDQAWCDEVLYVMRQRGYRLFSLFSIVQHPDYGMQWADALFLGDAASR